MAIKLTRHDIITALPKVQVGLKKYLWLQGQVAAKRATFHADPLFQRRYNGFYKVQRRDARWMAAYYGLMAQTAANGLTFHDILNSLYTTTGRMEASFASKLFATLNPNAPVIDAWCSSIRGTTCLTQAQRTGSRGFVRCTATSARTSPHTWPQLMAGSLLASSFGYTGPASPRKRCLTWSCGRRDLRGQLGLAGRQAQGRELRRCPRRPLRASRQERREPSVR